MKLLFSIFLLSLSISANCAHPLSHSIENRIAIYNRNAFLEPKTGVKKLLRAYDEWENPGFVPHPERDPAKARAASGRRFTEIVGPVLEEIARSIDRLEAQSGVTFIDGATLEESSILLGLDKDLDFTDLLISFLNQTNNRPIESGSIPIRRVAVINTAALLKADRSKEFSGAASLREFCRGRSCKKLFDELDKFAVANGCSLILDSSEELPPKLKPIVSVDLTMKFIAEHS